MTWIDATRPLAPDMVVYPGEPSPHLIPVKRQEDGLAANVSLLVTGVHAGTHVDGPCHFIAGATGADTFSPDLLIGGAWVADLGEAPAVSGTALEAAGIPDGVTRLFLKTRNARLPRDRFRDDFCGVDLSGARWLLGRGIRLLATDYLSMEAPGQGGEPHRLLLGAGVCVVENVLLSQVPPGRADAIVAPLLLPSDGAPARVFLRPAGQA